MNGVVSIEGQEMSSEQFRDLGSIKHTKGDNGVDVILRVKARWNKSRNIVGVLCNRRIPLRLKGKFYKTAIRSAMIYGTKCWAVKKHVSKMNVAEMMMLRWMCGKTRRDKIRNERIHKMIEVAPIEEKMRVIISTLKVMLEDVGDQN